MTTAQIVSLIVVVILSILCGLFIFKKSKSDKILKFVSLSIYAILLILWIVLKNNRELIDLIILLCTFGLLGFIISIKSKKNTLAKWIMLFIGTAIGLTWIFETGNFQGAEFIGYGMSEQGLTDIPNLLYYAINFAGDKIIYLLALGAFYAVLSQNSGYKKLVIETSKKFEGKEILFSVVVSFLIAFLTSFMSQSFVVLLFVPFLISVLLNMKLDKLTAVAVTFGSMLIGTVGATYGGEGPYWFNYYTGTGVETALIYRILVFVIAFVLFNLFNILHIKKLKNNRGNNLELDSDPFKVEKSNDNIKAWPILVLLCFLFVFAILGYISWETFKIGIFKDFHTWLIGLSIEDFAVFKVLLGTKAQAFGAWDLFGVSTLLIVLSAIVGLMSKIKLGDYIDVCFDGFKKMFKPIMLFLAIYMIMVVSYLSPVIPTMTNEMFKNLSSFNPYLVSLDAFIVNILHTDLGYTGFIVGTYFNSRFAENIDIIHIIFTTTYGFAAFFVPTSAILSIGLSYLDVDYKNWIKYIWKFVIAMLIVLIIIFTVMTYI